MLVSLEEAKMYLRVDTADEDGLIIQLLAGAEDICRDVARLDAGEFLERSLTTKVAVLYALAYLYEHREDADHNELTLSLRSLLSGVRKGAF